MPPLVQPPQRDGRSVPTEPRRSSAQRGCSVARKAVARTACMPRGSPHPATAASLYHGVDLCRRHEPRAYLLSSTENDRHLAKILGRCALIAAADLIL